jgi:transposase
MVLVTKWLHQGCFTWPPIRDGVVHLSADRRRHVARPVVPGTDAAVVKRLRHQAPDDIPAFVGGIRQYWMPTRYKRAT